MDRDNRKSHLAPQLSPATQELLRSTDSPTYFTQQTDGSNAMQTPTSGEIPILGTMVSPLRDRDQYNLGSIPNKPTPTGSGGPASAIVGLSLGRPGGSPVHSGMGPRVASSIPRQQTTVVEVGGQRSAGRAAPTTFSLPVRPGPPGGRLPPPPPRKESPDEMRRDRDRRQQQAGYRVPQAPANGGYSSGYPHQ